VDRIKWKDGGGGVGRGSVHDGYLENTVVRDPQPSRTYET
jgi:hypothetical protein